MIILYVGDYTNLSRAKDEAEKIFEDLNNKGFKTIYEGTMEEYLGIMFTHYNDRSFGILKSHLINRIIDTMPGMMDARKATTSAQTGDIFTYINTLIS